MADLLSKKQKFFILDPTYYAKIVITPDLCYEKVNIKNNVIRYRILTPYPDKKTRRLITKSIRKNDEVILNKGKTYIDTIKREDLTKIKI